MKRRLSMLLALCFLMQAWGMVDTMGNSGYTVIEAQQSKVYGIWAYEAIGVDNPYAKGQLIIKDGPSGPSVSVKVPAGLLNAYDVAISGGEVRFRLNLEGTDRVSVQINIIGDTMEGVALTSQGNVPLKGTRVVME